MLHKVTEENKEELFSSLFTINGLLARAAYDLGLPVSVYEGANMFQVKIGRHSIPIKSIQTPLDTYAATAIANNKFYNNTVWQAAEIPVAPFTRIYKKDFKKGNWDIDGLSFPLVIKPNHGTVKGNGVITDIRTPKRLEKLLTKAFEDYSYMLVEEYATGLKDYRVLVLNNQVLGVLERVPAFVIGNGVDTIDTLIDKKNKRREKRSAEGLGPIKVNRELHRTIKKQGFTIDSGIPKKRQRVQLKNVCNLGAGGEVHDVTDRIHPDNVKLAIKACKAIDLNLAGLDFLCENIAKPLDDQRGHLIEANPNPDIAMHQFPQSGESRDIAIQVMKAIKKMYT